MRSLFVLLIASLLSSSAHASTPEAFLKSAYQDPEVIEGNDSDYDPSRALSPFREVELYGETDDRVRPATEVGVKIDTKPYGELVEGWRARSREQGEFIRKLRLQQAIQRRYLLLVEFFHTKKYLKFLQDYSDIIERSFRAQGVAIRYGKSNAQSLLKAQVAVSNIQREIRLTTTHFESVKAQIKAIFPDFKEASFNLKNMISPEEISSQRAVFKAASTNTTQSVLDMQLAQMQSEQRISLARQNQWFKGFDVAVEERAGERIYKGALKFKLPFLGDDLIAHQGRSDRLTKIYEKQRELQEAASMRRQEPEKLKLLLDSYTQINKTLGSLTKVERSIVDPQVAIDVVLGMRSARSELMVLEKEILIAYVNLLYEQSILSQQSDVNHLSASKARL